MRISLEELAANDICSLGLKVQQKYGNDIEYIRTTTCDDSYLIVKTEKGKEYLSELKKQYKF